MKMIHISLNVANLYIVKGILESNGIQCIAKKENLTGLAGIIPMAESSAELWVEKDEDFDRAQEIVDTHLKSTNSEAATAKWKCKKCSEEIEGLFTSCWKCGTEKNKS